MLKRMVIKNFKCFRNETVFDFRKTNYKLLEQNTWGKILKGALFVGDNASGKTTAIQPIKLLLDLLFIDKDVILSVYTCLFSDEKITSLEYEFEIDGHEIGYSFSFESNSFVQEKLEVDKEIIIERLGESAKLKLENEEAFHKVDRSVLFLKRVYFNTKFAGNELLVGWFDFLKKSVYINAYTRVISTFIGESLLPEKYIEKHGIDNLNNFLAGNGFKYLIRYRRETERDGLLYNELADKDGTIFFEREGIKVSVPGFLESLGNQVLLNILPAVLFSVQNGGMLIIDEFSSGLHNKLEELLVKYIMRNGEKIQLFFVSHSTNLLSNSILRPDQIYSVEMFGDEGSRLYRFSDEQPRAAQNLEKMYLSGMFGGIPEYGIEEVSE
ncbi:MAG: ATP-binding protein [Lachnospiraceae bacterium]|nr:ATP-binding protein [Lachnospiraceae bacterium]